MKLAVYRVLEKISAEFNPDPILVTDVLGNQETDYNPYDDNTNLDKHYIRTKVRGTWGDPNIPRSEWTSSTAFNPWQVTRKRSEDIAKFDPNYAKLHKEVLAPLYAEMARTGLGEYDYNIFIESGRKTLPRGFKGVYNPNADYGGLPRKFSADEHRVLRNGVRTYVSKSMIPEAMKVANGDEKRFWYALASLHRLGHAVPKNEKERKTMDTYMERFTPRIQAMRDARAAVQREAASLNAQISELQSSRSKGMPDRAAHLLRLVRRRDSIKKRLE